MSRGRFGVFRPALAGRSNGIVGTSRSEFWWEEINRTLLLCARRERREDAAWCEAPSEEQLDRPFLWEFAAADSAISLIPFLRNRDFWNLISFIN